MEKHYSHLKFMFASFNRKIIAGAVLIVTVLTFIAWCCNNDYKKLALVGDYWGGFANAIALFAVAYSIILQKQQSESHDKQIQDEKNAVGATRERDLITKMIEWTNIHLERIKLNRAIGDERPPLVGTSALDAMVRGEDSKGQALVMYLIYQGVSINQFLKFVVYNIRVMDTFKSYESEKLFIPTYKFLFKTPVSLLLSYRRKQIHTQKNAVNLTINVEEDELKDLIRFFDLQG